MTNTEQTPNVTEQALSAFLLARIAEDEAVARSCEFPRWLSWIEGRDGLAGDSGLFLYAAHSTSRTADEEVWGFADAEQDHAARWDPARVLAECEARRIEVRFLSDLDTHRLRDTTNGLSSIAYSVLCRMAHPYADHPDFREDWRV